MMTGTQISVPKALELVRNSETGEVHPGVDATLEKAVVQLWSRIQASPDRYIMNKDEFAVFNYFQERFKGDETARKAVARFWNNFKGEIPRAALPKLVESGLGHRCSESTGDVVDDDRPYEVSVADPVSSSRSVSIFRHVSAYFDAVTLATYQSDPESGITASGISKSGDRRDLVKSPSSPLSLNSDLFSSLPDLCHGLHEPPCATMVLLATAFHAEPRHS